MILRADHQRLVDDAGYFERTRAKIAKAAKPGDVTELALIHEADNRCCGREPYLATVNRLTRSAPDETVYMQLDMAAWQRQS
jgi:hypothetical protein